MLTVSATSLFATVSWMPSQDELHQRFELGCTEFVELQLHLAVAVYSHIPRDERTLARRLEDFITQWVIPKACRSVVSEWRQQLQVRGTRT